MTTLAAPVAAAAADDDDGVADTPPWWCFRSKILAVLLVFPRLSFFGILEVAKLFVGVHPIEVL